MRRSLSVLLSLSMASLAGVACKKKTEPPPPATPAASAPGATPPTAAARGAVAVTRAAADLQPRSGSTLKGTATFVAASGQVTLEIRIENAPPGQRAFHLHEKGDCSAADASSAGAHWNPGKAPHGKWAAGPHHLGDVGNISVGPDGKGTFTLTTDRWTIGDGTSTDVLGKSLVIHGGTDDFASQPAGNAGGRIGCGVITASSPR